MEQLGTTIQTVDQHCVEHGTKLTFYTDHTDFGVFARLDRLADSNNEVTHIACCICFEWVRLADVYENDDGKWDMCKECGAREDWLRANKDKFEDNISALKAYYNGR